MGTLQLNCPLCCNESFTSYETLKCHLINVYENLKCSVCDKKCENLFELIEHIGRESCDEIEKQSHAGDTSYEEIIIKREDNEEEDEDDGDSTSMLIQTLSDNRDLNETTEDNFDIAKLKNEEVELEEQEDMYYCSSCDVSFPSINDHINEYHKGQEVFLEVIISVIDTSII